MEAVANEKAFEMDPEQETSARSVRLLVSYDVHAKMRHHFTVISNMRERGQKGFSKKNIPVKMNLLLQKTARHFAF